MFQMSAWATPNRSTLSGHIHGRHNSITSASNDGYKLMTGCDKSEIGASAVWSSFWEPNAVLECLFHGRHNTLSFTVVTSQGCCKGSRMETEWPWSHLPKAAYIGLDNFLTCHAMVFADTRGGGQQQRGFLHELPAYQANKLMGCSRHAMCRLLRALFTATGILQWKYKRSTM